MSLFRTLTFSKLIRGALSAATVLALAACADGSGFKPLYGSAGALTSVDSKLSQVETSTIPGRVGQRVRNELIFQNTGGDRASSPIYRLEIVLKENLISTLVERDGDSLSQIYSLDATFRLVSIADNKVLYQGQSFGRAQFERYTNVFANVRAREDAENRAARTVATDIKGRLATFLSSQA